MGGHLISTGLPGSGVGYNLTNRRRARQCRHFVHLRTKNTMKFSAIVLVTLAAFATTASAELRQHLGAGLERRLGTTIPDCVEDDVLVGKMKACGE